MKSRLQRTVLFAIAVACGALPLSPVRAQLSASDSTAIAIAAARFYLTDASRLSDSAGTPLKLLVEYRGVVIPADSLVSLRDPRLVRERPDFRPFVTPPEAERCLQDTVPPHDTIACVRQAAASYLRVDGLCARAAEGTSCTGTDSVTVWVTSLSKWSRPGSGGIARSVAFGREIEVVRRGTHWVGLRFTGRVSAT